MKFKLMTPAKLILEREVESVTLPGEVGEFTVLHGHDRILAKLKKGRLYIRSVSEGRSEREDFRVGAGQAEVTKDAAMVFVESAQSVGRGT